MAGLARGARDRLVVAGIAGLKARDARVSADGTARRR
jgi:hypothetical protein